MAQGILPIEYAEVPRSGGVTALAGLLLYLDLLEASGLRGSFARHAPAARVQGWSESQLSVALLLLNLAGGESVDDLRMLEQDEGLGQVVRQSERHGVRRRRRRAQERRFRRTRLRSLPSPSAARRYLESFHDAAQEELREPGRAFIPAPGSVLRGLERVNADLMRFVQRRAPQTQATLDMDATVVETQKRTALYSYEGTRAYQPLTSYWAEAGVVVHSEFRDGNVPAGHEQRRVLEEALVHLPAGVERVLLRSDTAGYQWELLRYCAEGRNERFGVIEFAVGVDVSPAFRAAVAEVDAGEWRELLGEEGERTGQEYAEVCFVPEAVGHSVKGPDYRFLAVREPLRNPPLPGMDEGLPAVELGGAGWYRIRGVVSNRHDLPGDELIRWYRARCGKGEEVHGVMKTDLAGGRLPSGLFGANAAWWAHVVLAFNLHAALRTVGLGPAWAGKRMKAVRFSLLGLPGRVVRHARRLIIQLSAGHPSYQTLVGARLSIRVLADAPP